MTALTEAALTLSRAEAATVAYTLIGLDDVEYRVSELLDETSRDKESHVRVVGGLTDLARHLELEMTIRAGGGWWGFDSPDFLDNQAKHFSGDCPDTFTLESSAVPALIELLPWMLAEVVGLAPPDDDYPEDRAIHAARVESLQGLCARLGVAVKEVVTQC